MSSLSRSVSVQGPHFL
uniref:Uncharacterized protein n=1 Tax=Arundo donax TaxID=35708 RepID=A0A0A8Z1Z2_ARUDO